jgi:hypothetical protein
MVDSEPWTSGHRPLILRTPLQILPTWAATPWSRTVLWGSPSMRSSPERSYSGFMADYTLPHFAWFESYRELSLDEALERARSEERTVRVLKGGDHATAPLSPARLNAYVSESGELIRLEPG